MMRAADDAITIDTSKLDASAVLATSPYPISDLQITD